MRPIYKTRAHRGFILLPPVTGTLARARGWSATVIIDISTSIPTGVGYEAQGRTRGFAGIATVTPAIEPLPAHYQMIPSRKESYDAPVLLNGQPFADSDGTPWLPSSVDQSLWGRFDIVVAGQNLTYFRLNNLGRKVKTIIQKLSDKDPGGDDQCDLVFPAITVFDKLGHGDLDWLYPDAHMMIRRVHSDGSTLTTMFEGVVGPLEDQVPAPQDGSPGTQLVVHCIGIWERLDDFITLPRPSIDQYIHPIPLGHLTPVDMADFIHAHVHRAHLYGWPGHMDAPSESGILTGEQGSYGDPIASRTLQTMLAQMQHPGSYYSIQSRRPRRLALVTRKWDPTMIDFTLWAGQRGVTLDLTLDPTTAFNAFYGQGAAPFGPIDPTIGRPDSVAAWANWQYPYAIDVIPAYPLTTGDTFVAGDGQHGFQAFSDELNDHGYNLDSNDTYLSSDVDEVERFQGNSGIQVDGIVGPQTWNQSFQTGVNTKILASAYIKELVTGDAETPFLTNARGGFLGPNPNFDPIGHPRRETLEQYGSVTRHDATLSARDEYQRIRLPIYRGTITATNVDPPEMNAMSTRSGMTMVLKGHRGVDRQLYVAQVERSPGIDPESSDRAVTWTVSEQPEGHMTIAQRLARHQGIKDLVAGNKPVRHYSKVVQSWPAFDAESGAGILRPGQNQTGGLWNKYLIPMGGQVDVSAVYIKADVATKMSACMFADPQMTVAKLIGLPGLANPSTGIDGSTDPWAANQDKLSNYGICWATGGPSAMQGYWPHDPGGALTGVLADTATWSFRANGVWGALFVWTEDSCGIAGDPAAAHRAIFPEPLV